MRLGVVGVVASITPIRMAETVFQTVGLEAASSPRMVAKVGAAVVSAAVEGTGVTIPSLQRRVRAAVPVAICQPDCEPATGVAGAVAVPFAFPFVFPFRGAGEEVEAAVLNWVPSVP